LHEVKKSAASKSAASIGSILVTDILRQFNT